MFEIICIAIIVAVTLLSFVDSEGESPPSNAPPKGTTKHGPLNP